MCSEDVPVLVRVGLETRTISLPVPGSVPIDRCIAGEVRALNAAGVLTIGSCCGHGKGLGWIAAPSTQAELLRTLGYEPRAASFPNYAGGIEVSPKTL